jgi:hypothetical protein
MELISEKEYVSAADLIRLTKDRILWPRISGSNE